MHSLRELLNRLKKNHPLFGALPAQVRSLLAAFDVELFCAHAQDYCERGSIYGEKCCLIYIDGLHTLILLLTLQRAF